MKLQVIIDDKLLKQIDIFCMSKGYTRSELIRQAIRDRIFPVVIPSPASAPYTGDPIPNQSTTTKLETFNKLKEQIEGGYVDIGKKIAPDGFKVSTEEQEDEQFKKYIDEPEPIYSKEDL